MCCNHLVALLPDRLNSDVSIYGRPHDAAYVIRMPLHAIQVGPSHLVLLGFQFVSTGNFVPRSGRVYDSLS
jgi:hypothetical protein